MNETDRIKYLRVVLITVGAIMGVQSIANPQHIGHLWGDVAALLVVAGVLAALTPRQEAEYASP
mgnify:CR=1 FL=1